MNVTKWYKTPLKISKIFKQIQNKTFFIWIKHKNFSPIKFTTNKMAYFDRKKKYYLKKYVWNVFDNNWLMMQTRLYTKIIQITINCHVKQQCSVVFFFIKMFNLFFSPTKIKWVHFVESVLLEYQAAKWISKEFVIHFILIYVK